MCQILYVTADDARKQSAENNAYYIGQALVEAGASLDYAHLRDFTLPEKVLIAARKTFYKARNQSYRAKADVSLMRRRAGDIQKRAQQNQHDLVLANAGPTVMSAGVDGPFAIYTDAPIAALKEMGHYLDDWNPGRVQDFIEIDRRAVLSAAKTIYHSEWAARQAIEAYGADSSKIAVVPPGANIPWVPVSDANLQKPKGEHCDLLFFGRDWHRKGGPEAQEITRELVSFGIETRLHVCGPKERPQSTLNDPNVVWHRPINKLVPQDLDRLKNLMQEADYMLLPTRADTSTSAIRESSAYGVPSIVTAVGGLGEMVRDGESGILIRTKDASAVVSRVGENYRDDRGRLSFRAAARQEYEVRMNWPVAGRRILEMVSDVSS